MATSPATASGPRASDFTGRLGESFRLRGPSGVECRIVLTQVEVHASRPEGAYRGRTPFSLIFHAPEGRTLAQEVYRLDSVDLGSFELLLVPVGLPGKRTVLEAVFG